MPDQISIPLQTAYFELMHLHQLRPQPDHMGSLMKVNRNGRDSWVVRRRVGSNVLETWLGNVCEESEPYIEKLKTDLAELKE